LSLAYLASLQLQAYEYPDAQGKVTAFPWDWMSNLNGQPAGFKLVGLNDVVVIIPGTKTLEQWKLNFEAFAETTDHAVLGPIHEGFWAGIEPWCVELVKAMPQGRRITIIGHSRGGAQCQLVAALLELSGIMVAEVIAYAPPRVGFAQFQAWWNAAGIPLIPYCTRNAAGTEHDYVPDVPYAIAALGEPYVQWELSGLNVIPVPGDKWGPFKYHHMGLYAQALGVTVPPNVLDA
jgi:Lipase (class 3)